MEFVLWCRHYVKIHNVSLRISGEWWVTNVWEETVMASWKSVLFCCSVRNWRKSLKSQSRLPVFCRVLNQAPYKYNSGVLLPTKFYSMMLLHICVYALWSSGTWHAVVMWVNTNTSEESASSVSSTNFEVSRDWISVRATFSAPVQTGPGAHPASCRLTMGTRSLSRGGRGMALTTHPYVAPRLKKE